MHEHVEHGASTSPSPSPDTPVATILLEEPEKARAQVRQTKTLTRSKSRGRRDLVAPTGGTKLETPKGRARDPKSKSRSKKQRAPKSPPIIDEVRRETMTKELADLVRLATSPKSLQSVNLDDFIQSLKELDSDWRPEEDEAPKISKKKLVRSESFLHLKTVLSGLDVEAAILGSGDDEEEEEDEDEDSYDGSAEVEDGSSYESSEFSGSRSGYSYSDSNSGSDSHSESETSDEGTSDE
jgi:hypothetical protein